MGQWHVDHGELAAGLGATAALLLPLHEAVLQERWNRIINKINKKYSKSSGGRTHGLLRERAAREPVGGEDRAGGGRRRRAALGRELAAPGVGVDLQSCR